jgi:imidazolonepropionase-like amidohydrolase
MQRSRTLAIRGARIFTGDGRVISSGTVLVRGGKIAGVYDGPAPDDSRAEPIEAAGKTLLPGLIDASVDLAAPGGFYEPASAFEPAAAAGRSLAAYLYCGVTGVRVAGDAPAMTATFATAIATGEMLGPEVFESLGQAYMPMLSLIEAGEDLRVGNPELLERGLVQQAGPPQLLAGTRKALDLARRSPPPANGTALGEAMRRLLEAFRSGVPLVAGSGAGAPLVVHGPGLQRELQLWVKAGIPARDALLAATGHAARLLGASGRIGAVHTGADANLLIVEGNPLDDIAALERISAVIFKGERIDRAALFER